MYTNVLEDFKAYQPMITCYHEGPRTRKLYIGDNTGSIRQYNMKNFEFIKNVNDIDQEKQEIHSYKQMLLNGKFDTGNRITNKSQNITINNQ